MRSRSIHYSLDVHTPGIIADGDRATARKAASRPPAPISRVAAVHRTRLAGCSWSAPTPLTAGRSARRKVGASIAASQPSTTSVLSRAADLASKLNERLDQWHDYRGNTEHQSLILAGVRDRLSLFRKYLIESHLHPDADDIASKFNEVAQSTDGSIGQAICVVLLRECIVQVKQHLDQQLQAPDGSNDEPPKTRREDQFEWLAKAMLLVRDNPNLSNAEIARRVGKNPSTLSRNTTYREAARLARGSRNDVPRGHVAVDDDGTHSFEAYGDSGDPADRDWDG